MSSGGRLEQAQELTADLVRRRKLLDGALRRRLGEPLRPGDLVAAEATDDLSIQWAVIDRDGGDEGRLVMVPADTFPFVGTADLEIVEETTGTPLILRCAHGIRVSSDALGPSSRSGTFEPASLWEARRRYEEALAETGAEDEADLEYQDWVREVLEPARTAWIDKAPARRRTWLPRPPRRTSFAQPWALAASVLLVVSLALGGGLAWQNHRLGELVESGRHEGPLNLPMAFLAPRESERGQGDVLALPPEAPRFALVLNLDPMSLHDRYRLRILSATGSEIWSSETSPRGRSTFLSLALPRDLFPDGEYRIRLQGLSDGDPLPAVEYGFEIARLTDPPGVEPAE